MLAQTNSLRYRRTRCPAHETGSANC